MNLNTQAIKLHLFVGAKFLRYLAMQSWSRAAKSRVKQSQTPPKYIIRFKFMSHILFFESKGAIAGTMPKKSLVNLASYEGKVCTAWDAC